MPIFNLLHYFLPNMKHVRIICNLFLCETYAGTILTVGIKLFGVNTQYILCLCVYKIYSPDVFFSESRSCVLVRKMLYTCNRTYFFKYQTCKRTRQIILYRATATLRRPQITQCTASNEGGGLQNQRERHIM